MSITEQAEQHLLCMDTHKKSRRTPQLLSQLAAECRAKDERIAELTRSKLLMLEAMQSIKVYLVAHRDDGLRDALIEVVDNADWLEGEPEFTVVTQFAVDTMQEENESLKKQLSAKDAEIARLKDRMTAFKVELLSVRAMTVNDRFDEGVQLSKFRSLIDRWIPRTDE